MLETKQLRSAQRCQIKISPKSILGDGWSCHLTLHTFISRRIYLVHIYHGVVENRGRIKRHKPEEERTYYLFIFRTVASTVSDLCLKCILHSIGGLKQDNRRRLLELFRKFLYAPKHPFSSQKDFWPKQICCTWLIITESESQRILKCKKMCRWLQPWGLYLRGLWFRGLYLWSLH